VKDAEEHAADDQKRKEMVEARNQADSLVYTTEKSLAEFGDKIEADEKTAIETGIAELKAAMEGDDADAIKAKTEVLSQASMKLGEAMYRASQEEAAAAAGDEPPADGDAGSAGADDVVDADFEEVDDDAERKDKTA